MLNMSTLEEDEMDERRHTFLGVESCTVPLYANESGISLREKKEQWKRKGRARVGDVNAGDVKKEGPCEGQRERDTIKK